MARPNSSHGQRFLLKSSGQSTQNGERSLSVTFSRHDTASEDGAEGQTSSPKKDLKDFAEDDVATADKVIRAIVGDLRTLSGNRAGVVSE